MKHLLLLPLLFLASCDHEFPVEGVREEHINKATELCKSNGGLKRIWYASTSNKYIPFVYTANFYCHNDAEFKISWEAK